MIEVRQARREDLPRVNELRKMVNDIHVENRPDIFKAGFPKELQDYIYDRLEEENTDILVAEMDGVICGFASIAYVNRPETPFSRPRKFCDVGEFCVDSAYCRKGVGTALITHIKERARSRQINRIELNVWEFNEGAQRFYENVGFRVFRRDMEIDCSTEGSVIQ